MLELVDIRLFEFVNQFVGISRELDISVTIISQSYLFKGLPVFMTWWGLWFAGTRSEQSRTGLLAVILVSIAAIFAGRGLALTLPFRLRPINDASLDMNIPIGMSPGTLEGLSSMPSDHAVLFFALALGIFRVHRLAGSLLLLHALFIVSLPRVYRGMHYPGDIIVGAIIGLLLVMLLYRPAVALLEKLEWHRIETKYAGVFYPVLFFITFQAASMFDSARDLVRVVGKTLLNRMFGG